VLVETINNLHRSVFAPPKQDESSATTCCNSLTGGALASERRRHRCPGRVGLVSEDWIHVPNQFQPTRHFLSENTPHQLQYKRFLDSGDILKRIYGRDFPHIDQTKERPPSGLKRGSGLRANLANPEEESVQDWKLLPRYEGPTRFGIARPTARWWEIAWWEAMHTAAG
jgi:hypothetical protein